MADQSETPTATHPHINIMLVSHTNAGKTTLVRTLLGKDVGEVLDAPDVTKAVAAHDLVTHPETGVLRLWDTPGFGDSFRLAKRLRLKQRWLAWLVRELWDRHRNPRLWRSQRLALDLRERATIILYLVNSMERPVDAIYVTPELEALGWIGKPVLAILNQSGDPNASEQDTARLAEWRAALSAWPIVQNTLRLDSYTRCWLQEMVLLEEIGRVLPEQCRENYVKLAQLLQDNHRQRFHASLHIMSGYLARLAVDTVELDNSGFGTIKELWGLIRKKIPWGNAKDMQGHELAMQALAQRLMVETKSLTDQLIAIHRLAGVSSGELVDATSDKFHFDKPVDEESSALAGGVVSGALAGLGADLLAGGLTLGTGALVGGVLGALGGAALARGYNVHSSKGKKLIGWSANSLTEAFEKSILLYLAVAHYGRGQGEWRRKDAPEHWRLPVSEAVQRNREQIDQLWKESESDDPSPDKRNALEVRLKLVVEEVLQRLYPEARVYLSAHPEAPGASASQSAQPGQASVNASCTADCTPPPNTAPPPAT